jgi:glycosyltransferase involved in cell wall biosynthesis
VKVVMTLLVRDEEDILRANIDFHLHRGVDEIVLMDNRSVDGTADIAREYERRGVLRYLFQGDDDYAQAKWVTGMARYAREEMGADWVINSDADEFWWEASGSLKNVLAAVGGDTVAITAERTNFVARPEDGRPFWRRMDVRHKTSFNALGDVLPGKVAHRGLADIAVEQGNHGVRIAGSAVSATPAPITVLHFPVRSRAQFFNKIAAGGAAYARNRDLPPGIGATWRHLYALHQAGELESVFRKELFSADDVATGLASGMLVRDERLADALASLGGAYAS